MLTAEAKAVPEILYGEQTKLTVENMSFSCWKLSHFPEFIISAAKVKKACAMANYVAGDLNIKQLKAINKACNALIEGRYVDQFPVDVYHGGGGIGVNMNMNEVIATLAGPEIDPVDHVNMSQSTADVNHTAMRMTVNDMLTALFAELDLIKQVLRSKAESFSDSDTIARTCMQDGMKVSAGALFEATASAVGRRIKVLDKLRQEMLNVNLGWTVIGSGTGANEAYREAVIEELKGITGLNYVWSEDPYDAAEYPDDLADVSSAIRMIAEIMSKLARDLRLLSSGPEAGFDEIILPNVQKGSSFFPGKVNPVIPETMIQCAMLVAGSDSIIQNCVGEGEIHINLWEDMMGFLLLDNIRKLVKVLRLFRTRCLEGLELNQEKCDQYASASIPQVVEMKEKYGYKKVSDLIHDEGLENALEDLKKGNV